MAPRSRSTLSSLAVGCFLCGAAIWRTSSVDFAFTSPRSSPGAHLRSALIQRRAEVAALDADLDDLVDIEQLEVHTGSADSSFVSFRQNFAETPEMLLNQQTQMMLTASHSYLAMASYFDRADVALPGFKAWAMEQSEEQREHGEKLIEYLNLRGGQYTPLDIPEPQVVTWSSALDAMKTALRMEMKMNQALLNMHAAADKESDAHMCYFLETELLTEQVESINQIAKVVRQLIRVGPGLGEYQVDKEMSMSQDGVES